MGYQQQQQLEAWADRVDSTLPSVCPKCGRQLESVRYGYDRTLQVIHLTGAINYYDYYVAECPHCGFLLLREAAT